MNNNILILTFIALTGVSTTCFPQDKEKSNSEIDFGKNSTHIARITEDTIVVVTGSTYLYTVDTPEDQGLISTNPGINQLLQQIKSKDGSHQKYQITNKNGAAKKEGNIEDGNHLVVTSEDGKAIKNYHIAVKPMALSGHLHLENEEITANTSRDLTLYFTAGQRSPAATVRIYLPAGIKATMENTTVNVIGRGEVKLKDLARQSIGRVGTNYSYFTVGNVSIEKSSSDGSVLVFKNLDLRPLNGYDLKVKIQGVNLNKTGKYAFKANYTTSDPEVLTSAGTGPETAVLTTVNTISDFHRVLNRSLQYKESADSYTSVILNWTPSDNHAKAHLMQSLDNGKNWTRLPGTFDAGSSTASLSGLEPNKFYTFRLLMKSGENKGFSNLAHFYTGKIDIRQLGVKGDGKEDDTQKINDAIDSISKLGGGTLLFSKGVYNVRTVHLKSNVWLYTDSEATIKALKGADAPETTWFSDKQYRSGLSPTAPGPYENPENWLTKQDVGHTFFRNTMFFAERQDNIKIIGTGRITGDGNLVTSDKVMDRAPDNRADKMFTFKLCTNIEIGGLYREEDLWYDQDEDEPYYIGKNGAKIFEIDNMLHIDQGGHFVLLATGTDNINVHNTYFAKHNGSNARDIYDFMGCNNVTATNIYSKVSSDDIVKLGSDCSLGFTRPVRNYRVRNVIGDTNCNLFQIGSETADDIMDVHVDNIYVLGANKAGFSISTNDGGHVKDVHLNCGHTGAIHSRSKMYRTRAPFFISISNRARILGAEVGRYEFEENGVKHDELLVKNVNIGVVENIILNGIDIFEVYGGSSYRDRDNRWPAYDGSLNKATPIVAGYRLPDNTVVKGGLNFTLPNGQHTGYIKNIEFNDMHVLVKGGNPPSDTSNVPPELGVGQYNVSNLNVQPSYGLWVRHAIQLKVKNSTFNYETRDSRYAIFLDDVKDAKISDVKVVRARDNEHVIKLKNSSDIAVENAIYYDNEWGKAPKDLSRDNHASGDSDASFP